MTKHSKKDAVALVIMESHATWPARVSELQSRVGRALVESQQPSESPDEFATRVIARLKVLEERGDRVRTAMFAVADTADSEAMATRYRIARAVLSCMPEAGPAELTICADEHVEDDTRHQLFAFAGALADALRGGKVEVHVRFTPSASKSGVRSSRPPVLQPEPAPALKAEIG